MGSRAVRRNLHGPSVAGITRQQPPRQLQDTDRMVRGGAMHATTAASLTSIHAPFDLIHNPGTAYGLARGGTITDLGWNVVMHERTAQSSHGTKLIGGRFMKKCCRHN